jgi:hypothetical protein
LARETEVLCENVPWCHSAHHRVLEPRAPRWEAGDEPPGMRHNLQRMVSQALALRTPFALRPVSVYSLRMFCSISDVIALSKVTNPKYGKTVYLTYAILPLSGSLRQLYNFCFIILPRARNSFNADAVELSCLYHELNCSGCRVSTAVLCLRLWTVPLSKALWCTPDCLEVVQVFLAAIGYKMAGPRTNISLQLWICEVGISSNFRSNPLFRRVFGVMCVLHCGAQFCIGIYRMIICLFPNIRISC